MQSTSQRFALSDFLTDGSVAALCDELSRVTGVPVWFRERSGRAVVRVEGDPPWAIVEEYDAVKRAAELAGWTGVSTEKSNEIVAPVLVFREVIGELVMRPSEAALAEIASNGSGQALERTLAFLAQSVSEACSAQASLRKRIEALNALSRLSSLLARAEDLDGLLGVALNLAIEVLRVDAGSIAVIDEESNEARIRSSFGLSEGWTREGTPLSEGGKLRKLALAGELVYSEVLAEDPRVTDADRVTREGLVSLLSVALAYQGRSIGLLRLYTRQRRRFSDSERMLIRAIAEHSATAIANERLRQLREDDERIQRQVRLAAQVQQRMLPHAMPHLPGFDIAARCKPSFELGGDFYDFIELDHRLGITIGDVVGKGVAAALLMAAVRASLRAHAQDVDQLDEVLVRVNAALVRDTLDNEFATMWYGVIDPDTRRLTYCAAGHEWPLLVHVPESRAPTDADVLRLTADGMALGIDPLQRYIHGSITLRSGDVLIAYTDGLPDAADFASRRFGGKRLRKGILELLGQEPDACAARIVEHVFFMLRQFSGLSRQVDDITLVVVRVE